jgi:hydrogenase nickel incorporation protein HypA/HybF
MHEFSIMTGVIEAVLKEIERLETEEGQEIEQVNEVFLEIGELTFLGADQLQFCYSVLSEKNRLKGSKLTISTVPAEVRCDHCEYEGKIEYYSEFHLETPILACPKCKETVTITKGRECAVRSVNLEIRDDE